MRLAIPSCTVLLILQWFLASGVLAGEYPPLLAPCNLADSLSEPERTMHRTMAGSLHDAQTSLLTSRDAESPLSGSTAITAVALAFEEYWERELTYPRDADQLLESGYLLDAWHEVGLLLIDPGQNTETAREFVVIYVPQPLGRTRIMHIPGRRCRVNMRVFREYSLLMRRNACESEIPTTTLATPWVRPFLSGHLLEALHIDQDQPDANGCIFCL